MVIIQNLNIRYFLGQNKWSQDIISKDTVTEHFQKPLATAHIYIYKGLLDIVTGTLHQHNKILLRTGNALSNKCRVQIADIRLKL